MSEQRIEDFVVEVLIGDVQKNALEFIEYLRANRMLFERWRKGFWENKLYWVIKLNNKYVCFVLVNGSEENDDPWIIWSDDSVSKCFENFPLDEHTKEIAWKNVDFCANCGSCSGGTCKTIFGKEFTNVCRTTFRFNNPDVEALVFIKKMVEIRKNDILHNS
ncbi:MAG: hypothetical protein HN368_23400 [Spirochaetales bacterium]|nr:hypothetical protein [Spirochaetales bacterium]